MFSQGVNYMAPFIIYPYLTRTLGLRPFGEFVVILGFFSICKILTDYGFNISGTYWVSKNKIDKQEVSNYLTTIIVAKLMLCSITILIAWGYIKFLAEDIKMELLPCVIFNLLSQVFYFNWFFNGIEKMKNITLGLLCGKITLVLMVLLLVKHDTDLITLLYCFGISNCVIGLISIILIYKEGYAIQTPNLISAIHIIKTDFSYFLSRASVGIYTSASTFLIGNFSGYSEAAIYSSAEKIYNACRSIITPISQAFFPYISRKKDKKIYIIFSFSFFIPITIISIIGYFFADNIIQFLFGTEFSSAAIVCRIFMFGVVISYISVMVGYPLFSLIDKLKYANYSVIISALFQLAVLISLWKLNELTAINVVFGIISAEIISVLFRVTIFIKIYKKMYYE